MWRGAARQIRYRKLNQREQSIIPFHVCGSRRSSSIYASLPDYGRPEPAQLNRLFNGSLPESGNPRGCVVPGAAEDSVSTLDAAINGAVHLPWFANQLRQMLPPESGRERFGLDPPWSSRAKAFASTAEAVDEDLATTDADEEASTSEEFQSNFEPAVQHDNLRELAPRNDREAMRRVQKNKYRALRRRQIKTETEAWQQAAKEYRELMMEMCQQKLAPNLPYMKSLFLGWFEPLRDVIAAEQVDQGNRRCKTSYGESLRQLPADMLAVITMHKLMGLLMTGQDGGCARVVQAAVQIGEAVEHEIRIHKFLEKTKKKPKRRKKITEEEEETVTKEQQVLRKRVTDLMKKQKVRQVRQLVKGKDESNPWGRALHAQVGSRLIELLIQTAYIQPPVDQSAESPPEIRPAFKHTLRTETIGQKIVKRFGAIECDPMVSRGLDRTARHMVIPYMPMLVPPTRWTGYDRGGYLFLPSYIMRTHGAKQQREAMKRVPRNQIHRVYDALDTLGSTRWRVNKRVLDVVDRIWSGGGLLADLVDREDVPIPEMPDTKDETDIKHWKWSVKKAKKLNSERHSQRCDIELKLAVARKMKDEECFFYPHNLDFRGRAYPMHPYLNHLGSDMCRGILEFAEGRPLGKTGLTWLKIHLANLFAGGVDKLSFDGRLAFVEDNINNIIDSAERPLEGKRWWLGAEDPFQCLSACINLHDVLKSSSPESVICHMPVHQDGSCNGLQHYAALGRDRLGAAAVNLIQGNKPADVYSGIAARVDAIMQRDALKDPATNPNAVSARLLLGQVDRKLVKQTVMTSVYGVTYIGARDQIRKRLKERGCIADEVALYNAACYAARTTLTALGEMFNAARSIMSWLGECAKVIASENEPVRWITPLGLPVVQPYRKYARQLVRTSLQVLALQHESDAVMVNRQRTAFPPNFVHSLDGSHMMMTAVTCKKAGLTFAGVHDSYWTHACDVDKMNRILREKFVELYGKPILENVSLCFETENGYNGLGMLKNYNLFNFWSFLDISSDSANDGIQFHFGTNNACPAINVQLLQGFESSFPNLSFPPLPDRSDFDLKEVLNSPYFFN